MDFIDDDFSEVSLSELVNIAFTKKDILTAYSYAILSDWHRAQDVVQESLLVVAGKKEIDQRTRGNLYAWVKGIVRRKSLEELRRIRREIPIAEETLLDLLSEDIDPLFNDSAEDRLEEMVEGLRKCIAMLPEHARSLLFDFYHEGKSGKELAAMSGRNEGAIRKQLHFLRGKLRKCLGERLGDKIDTSHSDDGSDWFVSKKWNTENAARTLDALLREAAFPIAAARCHAMDHAAAEDSSFLNIVRHWVRSGPAHPSRLRRTSRNPIRLVMPEEAFEPAVSVATVFERKIVRFPWKKAAAAILIGSAAYGTLAIRHSQHSETVSMTVTSTEGGAIRWRDAEQSVLKKGDRLVPGDWIETQGGRKLELDSEGTEAKYRIIGASRFGLLEPPFSWFARQRIELAKGGIAATVNPEGRPKRMEILTGGFSSLVSGTEFVASNEEDMMMLGVSHGEVRLRNRAGKELTRVSGGETVVGSGSGESSQVKKFGGKSGMGVTQELWWADADVMKNSPENYIVGEPALTLVRPSFESASSLGDFYVSRLSGWLVVPRTGDYEFWISCDGIGNLILSEEENGTPLLQKQHNVTWPINGGDWPKADTFDGYPSQKSDTVRLVAGRRYFMRATLQEQEGSDFLGIGWTGPGIPTPEIIDGTYLRVK